MATARRCQGRPNTRNEYKYGTAIVDTGASTNLLSTGFDWTLSNAMESTACIQGFEGAAEIKGSRHGIGHLYILGSKPNERGFQLSTTFDTVENINSNLFSISSLYEDHGFSLILRHHTYQGGRCELRRTLKDGVTQSIPISYDKTRSAFIIKFIMGKDKSEVGRRGREVEYRRGLTLKENMNMGLRSSLCPTKITKMGIILYSEIPVQTITRDIPKQDNKYVHQITTSNESSSYIPNRFCRAQHEHAHAATTPPEG